MGGNGECLAALAEDVMRSANVLEPDEILARHQRTIPPESCTRRRRRCASGGEAPILAFRGALARHDWKTLRECLDPDAVVRDHRMLGLDLSTGDNWLESVQVLA